MIDVEHDGDPARPLPSEVAANRLVLAARRRLRRRIRQILGLARAEPLGVEVRARDRAVGPRARRVVVVVPDADAVIANVDRVARIGIVERRGQGVGRLELEDRLPVDALALAVDDVVARVLRHLIDVGRARAIGDVGGARVAWLRERTPIVLGTEIAIAEADIGLVRAETPLLERTEDEHADTIVGEGVGEDARNFGRHVLAAILRRVDHAARRQRAAHSGLVEGTRGANVDRRTDAARRNARATRLVDFECGDALRSEVREIERARDRCAVAVADRRGRELAAVERDEIVLGAEAADGDELAFAVRTVDRHAGDALERFGQVGVGELADILGRDRVDNALRVALEVDRAAERSADAGNDDIAARIGPVCGRGALRRRGAGRRVLRGRRTGVAHRRCRVLRNGHHRIARERERRYAKRQTRRQTAAKAPHHHSP